MSAVRLAPRLVGYVLAGVALLVVGLATGRGGLVALGTPVLLAALAGAVLRPTVATATVRLADDQPGPGSPSVVAGEPIEVDEGGSVAVEVEVRGAPGQVVEVALARPPQVGLVDGPAVYRQRLDPTGRARHRVVVRPERWGRLALGTGMVRSADPLGLAAYDLPLEDRAPSRVRPRVDRVRSALRPAHLRPVSGSHPAAVVGPGIEFAGLRTYQPGDRARDLSWRASARGNALMVTERHPERGADLVVFVDTFAAEGLAESVRAALALVELQLAERDRVGLITFGGSLRLVRPGAGRRQLRRIVEALLDVAPVFSWAEKSVEVIPPRMLPRGATVVAISPLVDERTLRAVVDLARRGHEVGVIEVSPRRWTPPAPDPLDALAQRLWEMDRAARRGRLEAQGIGVARWEGGVALELVLAQLTHTSGRRRGARWRAA